MSKDLTPAQLIAYINDSGIERSQRPWKDTLMLGVMAGVYIALGGAFYTLVSAGSSWGFGPSRFLNGMAFSIGLMLVVMVGAELFTGNAMIMAVSLANKQITLRKLMRNWSLVYVGNFIGSIFVAYLVANSAILEASEAVALHKAVAIANAKASLTMNEAFFRGILCNMFVCLAVAIAYVAQNVSGKVLGILFPISAFVAMGFEHSVANMYLIPLGMMKGADVTVMDFIHNLIPVTIGNIIGGMLVGLPYWYIFLKKKQGA
ncbi:MAG: formate/nitrite transporter family protein [Phycisphaeraceae bacterium JB051]